MKYRCKVCGQIVEINEGDKCPICGADFSKLEPIEEEPATKDLVWAAEHHIGAAKGAPEMLLQGLRDQFRGECSEVGMYLAMARQALRDGHPEVALLLEQVAKEEAEHASRFCEMLGELVSEDTKANMEKMLAGENGACKGKLELSEMARKAGYDAVADSVAEMARDEARHGKALVAMIERYYK